MTRYIAILALTLPVALSSDYLSCFGQEANFLAYSNLVERPLDADNMISGAGANVSGQVRGFTGHL